MKWLGACQLSAVGFQLSASGCRLLAIGFRRAFGNPPSPLRGPLPPDKQWGAREYIGARHPPLDRGGQGRSADFRLPAFGSRQLTADSGKLIKEYTYNESSCNRSDRAAWL